MSFLTSPDKSTNPKTLGNAIPSIIISEKSNTAPKLLEVPTTIKNKKINL